MPCSPQSRDWGCCPSCEITSRLRMRHMHFGDFQRPCFGLSRGDVNIYERLFPRETLQCLFYHGQIKKPQTNPKKHRSWVAFIFSRAKATATSKNRRFFNELQNPTCLLALHVIRYPKDHINFSIIINQPHVWIDKDSAASCLNLGMQ